MKYILAVDDEQLNLNIISELLSDDYEIHTTLNGIECLKSIEKEYLTYYCLMWVCQN